MHVVFFIDIILRLTTVGHPRSLSDDMREWPCSWVLDDEVRHEFRKKLKTNQSGLLQLSSIAIWAIIFFKIKNENAFKLQMYKYDEVSP